MSRAATSRLHRLAQQLRALANHDFFPDLSARVRRVLVTPLGALTLTILVAALCGLFMHPRVFALAGGLSAVVLVGIGWPGLTARGVSVQIAFDRERCSEGEAAGASATIVNHLPWPVAGLTLRGGFGGDELAARFAVQPGRAESVSRWDFRPPRRGEYPVEAPGLATGFPFGIWEARRRARVEGRLIVWPRTFPVGPPPRLDSDAIVEGNVARQKVGATGEMLGVRPYRRGDSPRRIHWAQSAKHDRIIVCELESTSQPVIQLVLDANAAQHTPGPDGTLEWAVRIAASFARGWLESGAQVGLMTINGVSPPAAGALQLRRLMDCLARVPVDDATDLSDLLARPACRSFGGGVQVVITTDHVALDRLEHRRWVVLQAAGFNGADPASRTCDEGPPRATVPPWLRIDGAERIPHLLRFGWSEARHGS